VVWCGSWKLPFCGGVVEDAAEDVRFGELIFLSSPLFTLRIGWDNSKAFLMSVIMSCLDSDGMETPIDYQRFDNIHFFKERVSLINL
jgi:hypothetical protein